MWHLIFFINALVGILNLVIYALTFHMGPFWQKGLIRWAAVLFTAAFIGGVNYIFSYASWDEMIWMSETVAVILLLTGLAWYEVVQNHRRNKSETITIRFQS